MTSRKGLASTPLTGGNAGSLLEKNWAKLNWGKDFLLDKSKCCREMRSERWDTNRNIKVATSNKTKLLKITKLMHVKLK